MPDDEQSEEPVNPVTGVKDQSIYQRISKLGLDIEDPRVLALIHIVREDVTNEERRRLYDLREELVKLKIIAEKDEIEIARSLEQIAKLQDSTSKLQIIVSQQKAAAEEYLEKRKSQSSRIGFVGALAASFGIAAAASNLIAGYPDFVRAIKRYFYGDKFGSLDLIGSAYADTIPQAAAAATSGNIAPIFVYAVYVLLSLAYIVTLFFVFFAKEEKDKGNALDIFKNLNAFFIGSITGKFV